MTHLSRYLIFRLFFVLLVLSGGFCSRISRPIEPIHQNPALLSIEENDLGEKSPELGLHMEEHLGEVLNEATVFDASSPQDNDIGFREGEFKRILQAKGIDFVDPKYLSLFIAR